MLYTLSLACDGNRSRRQRTLKNCIKELDYVCRRWKYSKPQRAEAETKQEFLACAAYNINQTKEEENVPKKSNDDEYYK